MEHLTMEDIAAMLDETRGTARLVLHLAEACPGCGARYKQAQDLMARFKHWDPEIAILEGLAAEGLFASLLTAGSDFESWARRIEELEELQTWGVAWLAFEKSEELLEAGEASRQQARDFALLAAKIAEGLGARYHPESVADLKALAYAAAAVAEPSAGGAGLTEKLKWLALANENLQKSTRDQEIEQKARGLLLQAVR